MLDVKDFVLYPQGVLYNVFYKNMIVAGCASDVLYNSSLHQCAKRGACPRSAAIRDTSPSARCSTHDQHQVLVLVEKRSPE